MMSSERSRKSHPPCGFASKNTTPSGVSSQSCTLIVRPSANVRSIASRSAACGDTCSKSMPFGSSARQSMVLGVRGRRHVQARDPITTTRRSALAPTTSSCSKTGRPPNSLRSPAWISSTYGAIPWPGESGFATTRMVFRIRAAVVESLVTTECGTARRMRDAVESWKSFRSARSMFKRLVDPSHAARGERSDQNVGHFVANQLSLVDVKFVDSGRSEPPVPDGGRWRYLPLRLDRAKSKLSRTNVD